MSILQFAFPPLIFIFFRSSRFVWILPQSTPSSLKLPFLSSYTHPFLTAPPSATTRRLSRYHRDEAFTPRNHYPLFLRLKITPLPFFVFFSVPFCLSLSWTVLLHPNTSLLCVLPPQLTYLLEIPPPPPPSSS